jgi:hypothetical protein
MAGKRHLPALAHRKVAQTGAPLHRLDPTPESTHSVRVAGPRQVPRNQGLRPSSLAHRFLRRAH